MNRINQLLAGIALYFVSTPAFAQMGEAMSSGSTDMKFLGTMGLGAGLGIGLAAAGAAYGQGKAASAALDGIARNPSAAKAMNLPLLLSLALMESLVILAFLVNSGMGDTILKVATKVFGLPTE